MINVHEFCEEISNLTFDELSEIQKSLTQHLKKVLPLKYEEYESTIMDYLASAGEKGFGIVINQTDLGQVLALYPSELKNKENYEIRFFHCTDIEQIDEFGLDYDDVNDM